MLTLQQIQEQAYATACEKGWHERPLREIALSEPERRAAMERIAEATPFSADELLAANDRFRDAFGIGDQPVIHHDRVLAKHALMHTELTEAHDCIEAGEYETRVENAKPEGLAVEIADFIVRVGDTAGALGLVLCRRGFDAPDAGWIERAKELPPARDMARYKALAKTDIAVLWLSTVRRYVDRATEAARVDAWDEYAEHLTFAVLYAASIVAGFGLDLGAAIDAKMSYNKTRPHRHGGKQA